MIFEADARRMVEIRRRSSINLFDPLISILIRCLLQLVRAAGQSLKGPDPRNLANCREEKYKLTDGFKHKRRRNLKCDHPEVLYDDRQ